MCICRHTRLRISKILNIFHMCMYHFMENTGYPGQQPSVFVIVYFRVRGAVRGLSTEQVHLLPV